MFLVQACLDKLAKDTVLVLLLDAVLLWQRLMFLYYVTLII